MMDETHTGRDGWATFCKHHSEPGNLALHLAGFALFWGGLSLAVLHQDATWLFALVLSGPLATLGHQLFEPDVPAASAPPGHPWVPRYVGRMLFRIGTGEYADDLAASSGAPAPFRTAHPSLPILIPGDHLH